MSHSPLHVLHDIHSLTLVGRDDSNLFGLDPSSQELCHDLLHSGRLTSAWQRDGRSNNKSTKKDTD